MKIFIIGEFAGDEELCREKFGEAFNRLSELGLTPINPMDIKIPLTATWEEKMELYYSEIKKCEAVFALPCYKNHVDTRHMLHFAMNNMMRFIYYQDHAGYKLLLSDINNGFIELAEKTHKRLKYEEHFIEGLFP